MIAPAPRKPIPVTICAAIRGGSARTTLWPEARKAWKPYAETIVNSADPSATRRWVRSPASRWRISRSTRIRPPRSAASASRSSDSSQLSVGSSCKGCLQRLLLCARDLGDSGGGEVEQCVETGTVEGDPLRGRLHLHESVVSGHDDVHVDLGLGVLCIVEIEHRLAVDDADRDGCDRSGQRPAEPEPVEGPAGRDVRAADRSAACAAVRLEDVAVDPERALAERVEVGDRPERTPDQPLDLDRSAALP